MKFADPKNDLAFKKIFGDENKKEILLSFLNAILDFKDEKTIVDITLVNPYQVPKIEEMKETILDIKAINQKNEKFIIEMQKKDLGDFAKRSLYYTSKAYVAQLDKGKNYSLLNKVYFIGILNFTMFDNENYISRHLILNQETAQQDIEDFEFAFLELSKFDKKLHELETILDKWIYFLKNGSSLTMIPQEFENVKELKDAFEVATQVTWNKQELDVYDYIGLKEYDDINALQTAEKKGLKKGLEQGISQGLEQGLEQGRLAVAKNLLDLLDDETISVKTGLSLSQIRDLRK